DESDQTHKKRESDFFSDFFVAMSWAALGIVLRSCSLLFGQFLKTDGLSGGQSACANDSAGAERPESGLKLTIEQRASRIVTAHAAQPALVSRQGAPEGIVSEVADAVFLAGVFDDGCQGRVVDVVDVGKQVMLDLIIEAAQVPVQ